MELLEGRVKLVDGEFSDGHAEEHLVVFALEELE